MIRGAERKDWLELGRVYCFSWKEGYSGLLPADFLSALTPENSAPPAEKIKPDSCVVWENDDAIGGLVYFGAGRDAETEKTGEIYSLYVLPEYWRAGIGSKLFCAAEKALQDAGYAAMYLWVLKENARAQCFYERMGMRPTGEEREIEIAGETLWERKYLRRFRTCEERQKPTF